jgi:putative ABC transport system permease protein
MERLFHDIRYSGRMLRKQPGFTLVAVIALALGIGANTAIFSVLNAVVLRPLVFKQPERLVKIWGKYDAQGIPKNWISEPEYYELLEQTSSFDNIAAYTVGGGVNLTGAGEPVRVSSSQVNASLFPILGVQAAQGRTFLEDEDQPGKANVVLLSHSLWRSRFNGDAGIVGNTISLNDQNYTVVGVMPAGFSFPDNVDLWVPIAFDRARLNNRGSHYLDVIARLKPGVTVAQARGDLTSFAESLIDKNPQNYTRESGFGMYLNPLHEETVGDVRPLLVLLLVAVGFVLLIACFNVANMLLARAATREREMAVRIALGAGRKRLVRQLLTESVLLALIGGALGVLLAYGGVKLFVAFGPKLPRLAEVGVDLWVLAFSLIVTVLTGILFGLAPALHSSRANLNESLKEGGRGATASRHFVRNALVIAEVAMALFVLIGAGLTIKSFSRALTVDLGFQSDKVLTFRLSLPQNKYKDNAQVITFYRRLTDQLKTLPGVEAVGGVSQLPLSGAYSSGTTVVEDTSAGPGLPRFQEHPFIEADRRAVTPDYFASLGIRLLKGRLLTEADNETAPPVAVVDENFERTFWPEGSAVGKRIAVGGNMRDGIKWGEIVGVVAHVHHYGFSREGREQIYFPHSLRPAGTMYLTVRTTVEPGSLTSAARGAVASLDSDLPLYEVKTLDQLASDSVSQSRLNMTLLGGFAAIALLLASVGIYGVMSYSVTQRTHEIGIRMALGARPTSVLAMVMRQGMRLVGAGIGAGLVAAYFLTRLMASLLFGVSATDPVTFTVIALVLSAVALGACFVPARRATKVDPMIALRYE